MARFSGTLSWAGLADEIHPGVLPCTLFSGVKVWVVPAVWLAAKQAAVCGAVEVLGSRAVHMQVITGHWDAAKLLRTFWVIP